MTKDDFFDFLERKLREAPESERTEILQRYEEHFRQALANGESEEQITYAILYPNGGGHQTAAESGHQASSMRAILVGAMLALFNLIFILGPTVAICVLLFSLGVVGIVLLAVPFAYFGVNGFPGMPMELLFVVCSGVFVFGLGLLLTVGFSYLAPGFFRLLGKYADLNIKAIRGN